MPGNKAEPMTKTSLERLLRYTESELKSEGKPHLAKLIKAAQKAIKENL